MKIKLKEISRDDLKVGDTVGIARTVNCGWLSTFRHRKIIPVKITRITPKRTKIETDIYEEHGRQGAVDGSGYGCGVTGRD